MALEVIGVGLSRTGTESLKNALEIFGYGKCYHMYELLKEPQRIKYWKEFKEKGYTDFDALFNGYRSATDCPTILFYWQLMQVYPNAKIILTVREANDWYESAYSTILKTPPDYVLKTMKFVLRYNSRLSYNMSSYAWIYDQFHLGYFEGRLFDEKFMIDKYNSWNQQVLSSVPKDRLLVYNISEGWEPLCKFLNVDIPGNGFPYLNNRESFKKRNSLNNLIKEHIHLF